MTGRHEATGLLDPEIVVGERAMNGETGNGPGSEQQLGAVSLVGTRMDLSDPTLDLPISLPASFAPNDVRFAQTPCALSPDDFFPEKQGGQVTYPKRVCNNCEVRLGCTTEGLTGRADFGVWGGLSTNDIKKLRKDINNAISSILTDPDGKIDAFYDVLSGRDPIPAVRRVFVATIIDGLYGAEHAGPVVRDEISIALSDQEMVRKAIESAKSFYELEQKKTHNRLQRQSELKPEYLLRDNQHADDEQPTGDDWHADDEQPTGDDWLAGDEWLCSPDDERLADDEQV